MSDVPTLHIRNVPEEVYEGLRDRSAKERGTSMNAEAIGILEEGVRWKRRSWDEADGEHRRAREKDRLRAGLACARGRHPRGASSR